MFQRFWYQLGRLLITIYVRLIVRADIHHDAPMPKGAKIIAVNHPSTNDPAFITALSGEHMTILIKDTVFKVPLFGISLRMAGHVPVIAGQGRAALEEGLRLLRSGRTVMIFPEGVISPEGSLAKAHTGVARLALATGVPVVPVGISLDAKKINRIYKKIDGQLEPITWYLRGPYAMTVGESRQYQGSLDDHEQVRGVTDRIMQDISILNARGNTRLAYRAARAAGIGLATPRNTLDVAWKGTRIGFHQSARLIGNTQMFRLAESLAVFLMMFARQLVG